MCRQLTTGEMPAHCLNGIQLLNRQTRQQEAGVAVTKVFHVGHVNSMLFHAFSRSAVHMLVACPMEECDARLHY